MRCNITGRFLLGKSETPENQLSLKVGVGVDKEAIEFYSDLASDEIIPNTQVPQKIISGGECLPLGAFKLRHMGVFYSNQKSYSENIINTFEDLEQSTKDSITTLYDDTISKEKSNCICIWLISELNQISVFDGLLKMGYDKNNQLILLGYYYEAQDENGDSLNVSCFYANLPDITLFDALSFQKIMLKYMQKGTSYLFQLESSIVLSFGEYQCRFIGNIEIQDSGYKGDLSIDTSGGMHLDLNPLDGTALDFLMDVKFYNLGLKFEETYDKSESFYYIFAEVELWGIHTSARISFENSALTETWILLEEGICLSAILCFIFKLDGFQYSLFDFALREGSSLYYKNDSNIEIAFDAEITILGAKFGLKGKFHWLNNKDTLAKLCLIIAAPIDLEFLVFSGKEHEGPIFNLDINSASNLDQEVRFELDASINFVGIELENIIVEYMHSEKEWAIICRDFYLPIESLRDMKCTLSYSSKSGFSFADTSLFQLGDFDFLHELKKYYDNIPGDCEAIFANLTTKIKTDVTFTPSIGKSGTCYVLSFDIEVNFKDGNHQFATLVVRELLSIDMDKTTFFSNLGSGIISLPSKIIEQLFDDSNYDVMKVVLAKLVLETGVTTLGNLACKKIIPKEAVPDIAQSTSGGSAAAPAAEIVASGASSTFAESSEEIAAVVGGITAIAVAAGSGKSYEEGTKLKIPTFVASESQGELSIVINEVAGAVAYKVDIAWTNDAFATRSNVFLTYTVGKQAPTFEILEYLIYGTVYIAIRAMHSDDETDRLHSDWSLLNEFVTITYKEIIKIAHQKGNTVRECYQLLLKRDSTIKDTTAMEFLLKTYGGLHTKESIVKACHDDGDSAFLCLRNVFDYFPNISGVEILICMCGIGYSYMEVFAAFEERGVKMELITTLKIAKNKYEMSEISNLEWENFLTQLFNEITPLEYAQLLKDAGFKESEIAEALSKNIQEAFKSVIIGGILLDESMFPELTEIEMHNILSKYCLGENIDKAISILYVTIINIHADKLWNDSGIEIEEDEKVTINYLSGKWRVSYWDSDASGTQIIAKEGYLLPGKAEGCVVGKIGENGEIFYVGMQQVIPSAKGRLYLASNDDVNRAYGAGYADNTGTLTMIISKRLI
ncbi:MAG: hypothetical protein R3Y58_12350 [Eubacteriales bacterium]